MDYRRLGASGLKVPVLAFGTGTFGGTTEFFKAWGQTRVNEARRLVDICLDAGVTLFDSADTYSDGTAEEVLGAAIAGRSKDMIISGGENIYPAELEAVMAECPAIADSAVIGLPDARWGEVPVAVVIRRAAFTDGAAPIDEAGVLALFDGRLARYKHPKRVVFVDALPKTALGKVRKEDVRRLVAAEPRATHSPRTVNMP